MSEESFSGTTKGLYKKLCQDEWNPYTAGILVAFFSVLMLAWSRPWGAAGGIRNWGDWVLYGAGFVGDAPSHIWESHGSIICIGFVAGAFLSATLGSQFAIRIPPFLEMVKAVVAGCFMGVGAALAGGCNVGGFYNAIGNLSAHGFAMWGGLIIGAIIGLKYIYWEMEHVSWGSGGAKNIEFPVALQGVLAVIALGGLIWGAYAYSGTEGMAKMGGVLLIAAALGYCMQRGRWCMIQGFREPHMTGDATMAKSIALSLLLVAIGGLILKASGGVAVEHYVRGTFGWGALAGGVIFAFGAMLAGGCGTGTLWRVGEGQIKLWIVVPFFGIANSLMTTWFRANDFEGMELWFDDGITDDGILGRFVFMPETFLGYGGTIALIALAMALWYVIVKWNEKSGKLIVDM